MNFIHLNEHKFRHNFNDTINPICSCGKEPETTLHYFLRCEFYSIYRLELLNDICDLNHSLKNISEVNLLEVLLYGAEEFSFKINSEILKYTTKFIKKTRSLLWPIISFLIYSPSDQVLNIFLCILCSIYLQNLHYVIYVLRKFHVLSCLVLLLLFVIALQLVSGCILL